MRGSLSRAHWIAAGTAAAALAGLFGSSVSGITPDRTLLQERFHRPSEIPFPDSNPYSEAKASLGRTLFFDPILSGSQALSCATCHNPALSWTDGRPKGVGEKTMATRTPTLLNVAWIPKPGWDGRFRDLKAVAFAPISSPTIMNLPEATLIERLSAIPGYVAAFDDAFGKGPITRRKVELALATYQRLIVSSEAPFDRWVKGDENALSPAAKRGFAVFAGKAKCGNCHEGWAFTDAGFYDIGIGKGEDIGRGKLFATSPALQFAFKTPTLRNVSHRPPYMHDGSIATLEGVIDHYDKGGIARPSRSEFVTPLNLTKGEKADLLAFLRTLDSPDQPVSVPKLPR